MSKPRRAPITPEQVKLIARLSTEEHLSDGSIATLLGLDRTTVHKARQQLQIEASVSAPEQPVERVAPWFPPEEPPTYEDNARWCQIVRDAELMLNAGIRVQWWQVRRAVRRVLNLGDDVADEAYLMAAQRDRRSADELARLYLAEWDAL